MWKISQITCRYLWFCTAFFSITTFMTGKIMETPRVSSTAPISIKKTSRIIFCFCFLSSNIINFLKIFFIISFYPCTKYIIIFYHSCIDKSICEWWGRNVKPSVNLLVLSVNLRRLIPVHEILSKEHLLFCKTDGIRHRKHGDNPVKGKPLHII